MARKIACYLRLGGAATSLVALMLLSHPAGAEGDPADVRARSLFREGHDLAKAGQYEKACPKFEESLKLDPGIGTEFNLADCWEHIGRTASAQGLFVQVAEEAHNLGQTDREKVARERAGTLDAKTAESAPDARPDKLDGMVISASPCEPSTAPGGGDDASLKIQAEYASLAEIQVGIDELRAGIALLARGAPWDPRARRLRAEVAMLETRLSDAWRVAARATAALAWRSALDAKRATCASPAATLPSVAPAPSGLVSSSVADTPREPNQAGSPLSPSK